MDLAHSLAGTDAGLALAHSLADADAGRDLAHRIAYTETRLALASSLADADAGLALANSLAGTTAGVDLITSLAGTDAGLALATSLAGTTAGVDLATSLAGTDAGLALANSLAGTDAGLDLITSLADVAAGQALANRKPLNAGPALAASAVVQLQVLLGVMAGVASAVVFLAGVVTQEDQDEHEDQAVAVAHISQEGLAVSGPLFEAFATALDRVSDHPDVGLSDGDRLYLQPLLGALRAYYTSGVGLERDLVERPLKLIAERLAGRLVFGDAARDKLIELGAHPPEAVQDILDTLSTLAATVGDTWSENDAGSLVEQGKPIDDVGTSIGELRDELEDIGLDMDRLRQELDNLRTNRTPGEPKRSSERVDPGKQVAKGAAFGVGKQAAEKTLQEAAERGVFRWLGRELPTWDGVTARFIELIDTLAKLFIQ